MTLLVVTVLTYVMMLGEVGCSAEFKLTEVCFITANYVRTKNHHLGEVSTLLRDILIGLNNFIY